ncbi:hypothetical protein GL218_07571 [Daldinia childiae]|uniref:uncharacterized protein n=1 Tax=Daldinia childiae TaxID=326645 RepID=UPI0014466D88|nr:uncharacterized protein GL218_07571 [Daldinia childiae]KAF3054819.1 hypothetical protein GL218_07571 [Daldinia childiae]
MDTNATTDMSNNACTSTNAYMEARMTLLGRLKIKRKYYKAFEPPPERQGKDEMGRPIKRCRRVLTEAIVIKRMYSVAYNYYGLLDDRPDTPITSPKENSDTHITPSEERSDTPITVPQENLDTPITVSQENPDTSITPPEENPDTPITPPEENPDTSIILPEEHSDTPTVAPPEDDFVGDFDLSDEDELAVDPDDIQPIDREDLELITASDLVIVIPELYPDNGFSEPGGMRNIALENIAMIYAPKDMVKRVEDEDPEEEEYY